MPGFCCQMRQIPCEMGLGTSLFTAVWGISHRCAWLQAGLLLQSPHPALDQLLQLAGCPAPSVPLTSLTLSFVYAGGESHPRQQSDAGLAKKLPRGLSPEERKRFAQVDKSVHPQPFAQENQRRCPAAVAGEAGTASCEEAQGLGTS